MKALLHYRASPGFRRALAQAGTAAGVETVVIDDADSVGLERELIDADLLLHVLTPFTEAMIGKAPRLRLIQKIGVGVNTIALEAAKARGIAVCNMPGSNSRAVAEMTLALMLTVLRKTVWLDSQTLAGKGWTLDLAAVDDLGEIGGRTIGFVGFGAIPLALAPVVRALGAEILYTATSPKVGWEMQYRVFEDLLEQADIVSLHAPLNPQTSAMMDAAAFARMRPGAVLINTARGGLVDEQALLAALQSGLLRGAGLDVFGEEPVKSWPSAGRPRLRGNDPSRSLAHPRDAKA